ncbi:MAG: M28 family peptidase [Sulfurovaceae bacterium]|nr:M28 family peptidase [Sulfurovaceae bacterium]
MLTVLILFPFIVWFLISQPTFGFQSKKSETTLVKAENLKHHVHTIVETFNDRGYTNTEMLDNTAEYIYTEFSKYSDEVAYQNFEVESFLDDPKRGYKNVIVNFKGAEGCDDEVYIIGAHYDTFGGLAGANDNTSAVAGLIELARLFKENPPQCNLQIVAYSLEEPPFFRTEKMGSFVHAQSLKENGTKVKLAIVLDMIGFYSDEENSQRYPFPFMRWYYPTKANFISIVGDLSLTNILHVRDAKRHFKKSDLPVYSINAPSFVPGIDFSDHQNYWKLGYPAIFITDTAFYRSDNYHTEKDTPDSLDYEKMAKVVEGVFETLRGSNLR